MRYPVPENEDRRNEALRAYRIMDTPPENVFTELGELAAQICECPISYVSFIEEDRFWIKAKYGLPEEFESCPREIAFCSVTVCGAELVYSPNLAEDDRFRNLPFVLNEPHYRFYCAMPLITPEGYALGTICVMDLKPRELRFEQRETLRRLAHQMVGHLEHRRRIIELNDAMQELDAANTALAKAKSRTDELLNRILPESIAVELKEYGKVEPHFFSAATILLADVKGFTRYTETSEPASLIALLERYFATFDEVIARHHVEKLKTIGDAYLAVSGLPDQNRLHVLNACLAALEMLAAVDKIRAEREKLRLPFFEMRIGIHTGPVIAGIVGRHRFTYDIWGDAVNVVALMEAKSEPGRINVSENVFYFAKPYFEFVDRGTLDTEKKGAVPMYFLDRLKPQYSRDAAGRIASEALRAQFDAGRLPLVE
jgi:adenylate cyclase